jgi:hypothetical protein
MSLKSMRERERERERDIRERDDDYRGGTGRGRKKAVHPHVICDSCKEDPIVGARYHCTQCIDVDLCEKCEKLDTFINEIRGHSIHHPLLKITRAQSTGLWALTPLHLQTSTSSLMNGGVADENVAGLVSSGIDLSLFANEDEASEFTCPICLNVCFNAKMTDCGKSTHAFCLFVDAII